MLEWQCVFLKRLMTLTIDLPSGLEQYLLQEAQAQGVSLETMTLRVLINSMPMLNSSVYDKGQKPDKCLTFKKILLVLGVG
jgi:hypothetical protein